jgi:hypothetical protein
VFVMKREVAYEVWCFMTSDERFVSERVARRDGLGVRDWREPGCLEGEM